MTIRCTAFSFLFIAILACQSIEGHHELDRGAPFEEYATYAWVTEEPLLETLSEADPAGSHFSPVHEELIRAAVERELVAKGYEEAESAGAADIVLSFTLGAREKILVNSYPVQQGYRYGPYYGKSSSGEVDTYMEGTLTIDVFDGESKQAVWQGWASKRLREPLEEEDTRKSEDTINRAVDAILSGFPARGAGVAKSE